MVLDPSVRGFAEGMVLGHRDCQSKSASASQPVNSGNQK